MPCRMCGSCDHIAFLYGGAYLTDLKECGGRNWYDLIQHCIGRFPQFWVREVARPEGAEKLRYALLIEGVEG